MSPTRNVPQVLAGLDASLARASAKQAGAVWRLAEPGRQLDANLVRLLPGARVGAHVEEDLDVLLLVLEGSGLLSGRDQVETGTDTEASGSAGGAGGTEGTGAEGAGNAAGAEHADGTKGAGSAAGAGGTAGPGSVEGAGGTAGPGGAEGAVRTAGPAGSAAAAGDAQLLEPHGVAWLPRGSRRALSAGPEGLVYLTVHQRRPAMGIRTAFSGVTARVPVTAADVGDLGGEGPCLLDRVCAACGRLSPEASARYCGHCAAPLPSRDA